MNFTKGEVIAINKPLDMTSFSALAYVRKRLCMRLGVKKLKVGHAGISLLYRSEADDEQ